MTQKFSDNALLGLVIVLVLFVSAYLTPYLKETGLLAIAGEEVYTTSFCTSERLFSDIPPQITSGTLSIATSPPSAECMSPQTGESIPFEEGIVTDPNVTGETLGVKCGSSGETSVSFKNQQYSLEQGKRVKLDDFISIQYGGSTFNLVRFRDAEKTESEFKGAYSNCYALYFADPSKFISFSYDDAYNVIPLGQKYNADISVVNAYGTLDGGIGVIDSSETFEVAESTFSKAIPLSLENGVMISSEVSTRILGESTLSAYPYIDVFLENPPSYTDKLGNRVKLTTIQGSEYSNKAYKTLPTVIGSDKNPLYYDGSVQAFVEEPEYAPKAVTQNAGEITIKKEYGSLFISIAVIVIGLMVALYLIFKR